jgi:hypothetical protein
MTSITSRALLDLPTSGRVLEMTAGLVEQPDRVGRVGILLSGNEKGVAPRRNPEGTEERSHR